MKCRLLLLFFCFLRMIDISVFGICIKQFKTQIVNEPSSLGAYSGAEIKEALSCMLCLSMEARE